MGRKICEVIPCDSFKERMGVTRKLRDQGYYPTHLGNNLLYIDYSIKGC